MCSQPWWLPLLFELAHRVRLRTSVAPLALPLSLHTLVSAHSQCNWCDRAEFKSLLPVSCVSYFFLNHVFLICGDSYWRLFGRQWLVDRLLESGMKSRGEGSDRARMVSCFTRWPLFLSSAPKLIFTISTLHSAYFSFPL